MNDRSLIHMLHVIRSSFLLCLSFMLFACGGQATLKTDQAVIATAMPQAAQDSRAQTIWRAKGMSVKGTSTQFKPVIEGNVVYTVNEKGNILGLELTTGKAVFNHQIAQGVVGSLVGHLGVNALSLFAATKTGNVLAIDRKTGEEKWRSALGVSISAAPTANNQMVLVRSIDGKLFGINAATGEVVWAVERPIAAFSLGQDAASLIAGEGVVTGFSSGRLLASNVFNGQTFWERRAFRPRGKNKVERLIDMDAPAILAGDSIIVGAYQAGVVAYNLREGSETWRNADISTRKALDANADRLAVTEAKSEVSLLKLKSGELLWQQKALSGHGLSAPIIMNDAVYVGSLVGILYRLDLKTGDIISQLKIASTPISTLQRTASGLLVYAASSGFINLIKP